MPGTEFRAMVYIRSNLFLFLSKIIQLMLLKRVVNIKGVSLMVKDNYSFEDLVEIMRRLRAPDGCPWDKVQTHESILEYLVEEAAEFIDAVKNRDDLNMCEEIGDVLLQVVFHAQMAKDREAFEIQDVLNSICKKMVFRHPHVFGEESAETPEDVKVNWDKIKSEEKKSKGVDEGTSVLDGIPKSLPGLSYAKKAQKKAAKVGFDWVDPMDVFPKIQEEIAEVKEVLDSPEKLEEEMGDLLFSVVNLSRKLNVDPEIALRGATEKFINRFKCMEGMEPELKGKSLEELDELWDKAKRELQD